MKSRLTITVEDKLIEHIKAYADKKQISVSELVENYFRQLTEQETHRSIIELVEEMQVPELSDEMDLVEEYHTNMEKRYDT